MSDIVTIEIESLTPSGDGLARQGRLRIVVPFTIPGELVRARVDRRAGHGAHVERMATLIEVLRASPHRVVPKCPHFDRVEPASRPCGGCSWQHIAYEEQLRLKRSMVDSLIRAAVPSAPSAEPVLPSTPIDSPWGYRHKVHFVFGSGSGRDSLAMGHFARGSRRVVPVRECPVHADAGNRIAFALRDAYIRSGIIAADSKPERSRSRRTPRGALKSVAVRVARGTPEMMTTVVVAGDTDARLRAATRGALTRDSAGASLHVNIHPRSDAFIFGRETRRIFGPERMREIVEGQSFLISPTAFFQTNIDAAAILVRLVLAAVPSKASVLDLYAGAGLFALSLAARGQRVIAVEANAAAVRDGVASRDLNGITEERCRFIARPVETALERLPATDVVVLDPPREGCAAGVLKRVFAERRPRAGVYVSCNPEALARDLAIITRAGYRVVSVQPVDMFPHTAHIETVAVVDRDDQRVKQA